MPVIPVIKGVDEKRIIGKRRRRTFGVADPPNTQFEILGMQLHTVSGNPAFH
jgi:hypothetical protein